MLFWYVVIVTHMTLGLAPKILYAIKMIYVLYKLFWVINTVMGKLTDIKHVILFKEVSVNDAIRLYFLSYNRDYSIDCDVRDNISIDAATTLKDSKNRNFVAISAITFTFASAAKIAFINFYLNFYLTFWKTWFLTVFINQ